MIEFELDMGFVGDVLVKLHPDVLKAIDEEWRNNFYDLEDDKEVAEHIAYNVLINHWQLSELDGFANLPNNYAIVEIL